MGLVLYGTAITTQGAGYSNAICDAFCAVLIWGRPCMFYRECQATTLRSAAERVRTREREKRAPEETPMQSWKKSCP